jgi:hypothetical protein
LLQTLLAWWFITTTPFGFKQRSGRSDLDILTNASSGSQYCDIAAPLMALGVLRPAFLNTDQRHHGDGALPAGWPFMAPPLWAGVGGADRGCLQPAA